jgi:putative sterol carrier protein
MRGASNKMGPAKDQLAKVLEKMNTIEKAKSIFVTNIGGEDVDWEMSYQFNLDNEEPFYVEIKDRTATISEGTKSDAQVIMSGDNEAIVRICQGKGDFTHAISREQIKVEQGKVMDIIRLTRAITLVLQS